MKENEHLGSILFFDGQCNLCNRLVDFLIRRQKRLGFYYASLQGQSAKKLLQKKDQSLKTVVLLYQGEVLKEGDAVLKVLKLLGGVYWLFFAILWPFPIAVVNFFYRAVAKRRYSLWGRRESCRLPTEEEKLFFLD